mgnify:CR=1 FL=1
MSQAAPEQDAAGEAFNSVRQSFPVHQRQVFAYHRCAGGAESGNRFEDGVVPVHSRNRHEGQSAEQGNQQPAQSDNRETFPQTGFDIFLFPGQQDSGSACQGGEYSAPQQAQDIPHRVVHQGSDAGGKSYGQTFQGDQVGNQVENDTEIHGGSPDGEQRSQFFFHFRRDNRHHHVTGLQNRSAGRRTHFPAAEQQGKQSGCGQFA